MKTAGIICEYNPIHNGHVRHIAQTRAMLGEDGAIVCAMSGNFVQRGDFAVFAKHARAMSAVASGADLVVELPLPYVLSSAEGFARGGVGLLEALGVCTHLSFGSEAGETGRLLALADCLLRADMPALIGEELKSGISFARARQRAAERIIGKKAEDLSMPNNILGVEYLKALKESGSVMAPLTVRRFGAQHDSDGAESASKLRRLLKEGMKPWGLMPASAARVLKTEVARGRGPVFMEDAETAVLSRLRMLPDESFARLPDASEGLELRLRRYARTMPTVRSILESTKTKRYSMSRLRRMLLCAVLGVEASDSSAPPAYIRVLAMNQKGMALLREIKEKSALPVITKPASAKL
ncbi:MAG: nucleotidyltransferase family protein, partial [Clostridiales bacterium]|nr:nucleotidyltransferase family protein [Clostridiales bacterium]